MLQVSCGTMLRKIEYCRWAHTSSGVLSGFMRIPSKRKRMDVRSMLFLSQYESINCRRGETLLVVRNSSSSQATGACSIGW